METSCRHVQGGGGNRGGSTQISGTNVSTSRWLGVAVLAAVAVSVACGGTEEQVRRASRELASRLAAEGPSNPTPEPTRDSLPSCRIDSSDVQLDGGARLYLDATESMAGFTQGQEGSSRFDLVLDRISGLTGLSDLTLFGRPSEPSGDILTEVPFRPNLHRRATFSRVNNPDYCLYRAITSAGGNGVHLYLSDGVQSAVRYGVPSPTAVALREWLAAGHSLAILAFRSEFDGRAWSEQLREWVGRVQVEDRPFYVFVLAPDSETLDAFLENRAGPGDFDGHVDLFRFSPNPVRCRTEASGHYQQRRSSPPWSFLRAIQQEQLQDESAEIATVQCERPPSYPLGEVLVRVESEYRPWVTGQASFGDPESPPAGAMFSAEPVGDRSGSRLPAVEVRGSVPDDTGTRFGFYHLTLEVHPGELVPAVADLTTDSDADPESFGRTYRFDWLLEHLVRWQIARSAPTESFSLTLTYR